MSLWWMDQFVLSESPCNHGGLPQTVLSISLNYHRLEFGKLWEIAMAGNPSTTIPIECESSQLCINRCSIRLRKFLGWIYEILKYNYGIIKKPLASI